MEHSYESAAALVCAIGGASAEHLLAFVGSLTLRQYLVSYVCPWRNTRLRLGTGARIAALLPCPEGRRHRAVSAPSIAILRDATPRTARFGTADALLA
jgi:hypothetical protein